MINLEHISVTLNGTPIMSMKERHMVEVLERALYLLRGHMGRWPTADEIAMTWKAVEARFGAVDAASPWGRRDN